MNRYPLIKFVLLFICGIILQKVFNWDLEIPLLLLSFLILSSIPFFISGKYDSRLTFLNIFLSLSVLISGVIYFGVSQLNPVYYPFEKQKNTKSVLYGCITDIELEKDGNIVFTMNSDSVIVEDVQRNMSIKVLCRIYDEDINSINRIYNRIGVGNYIIIKGTLQKGREKRNPGEYDHNKYLKTQNISAVCNVYKSSDFYLLNNDTDIIKNAIFTARKSIDRQIAKLHTPETAALIRGLLLADRSKIDYQLRESFVNAGVVHVLAVSGLHVGFIVLIFLFLFGRFNIYLRYIFTILGLILFVIITGSPPSVFRASVMAITLIAAFLFNRSYNSINSLALAALILLLLDPAELFNPGFQLSFSAVLSIVLIYPILSEKVYALKLKSGITKYLLLFFSVSMAAQIGTLPFTLIYFHKLSIVALFVNLFVIPAIGAIVALSIFTLAVSSLWTWLAIIYASATNGIVELLCALVNAAGTLKISHIYINQFTFLDSLIFYVIILSLFYFWRRFKNNIAKILLISLLLLNGAVYFPLDNRQILKDGMLSIMAVDVGQGDGILIRFPNGSTALIDAGDRKEHFDSGERIIAPLMQYLGIDKIDYGFVSHLDSDHYGGFITLLNRGLVDRVYKPPIDSTNENDLNFEDLLHSLDVSYNYYKKDIIEIDYCRIYVLNTASEALFNSFDNNDKSGILKLVYGETSFLFTGDAGFKVEDLLIDSFGKFIHADLLKVGHHGSKNSTSDIFLDIVSPETAVISAGIQNKFRHPAKLVLDKLTFANIKIDRTDLSGAILYQSDGKDITKVDWKSPDRNWLSNY